MTRATLILLLTASVACATVPTDTSRLTTIYACDGSDTTFTWTFGLTDDDDLQVILITDATGAETLLTKTSDYTLASANANDPQDWSQGGTVTTVATYSSDYSILLRSNVPRTQLASLDDEEVEEALDKLSWIAADIYEVLSRCLKIQPSESGDTVQFVADGTAGFAYRDTLGDWSIASLDGMDITLPQAGVYNVQDYGATGNGSTDDTVAIQTYFDDCVANNRPAILPKGAAGIYKISSTITVGDGSTVINGFTMQGEGWESVKFLWAGGTSDNMIEFTSCTGLTLDNIAIDGNDTAGVNGIYHTTGASAASQHTTLRNCQIRRCKGVGYHVKQWSSTATCDYLTFHNCELAYNGTGLKVEGGVRQVDFFGGGILVSDSFGVHIVDGVVHFYDITFALNGPAYTTGTATFTNGSASITGSGTSWTSAMEGCRIRLDADGAWYTVQTVTDATHLTLTASYADTGGSGAYMIAPHPNTADIYLEGPISSFQIHGGTTESLKLLRGDWANDAGWSGLVAQNIIIGLNQSHNEAIGGASAIDVFIDYDCPKPLHLIGVKAMGDIALGSKCAAVWDYQTDFWNWERLPTDANPLTGFTGNTTVVNHFGYTDPTINPRQMVNTLLLGRGRVMIAADTWMNGIDLLSVEGTVYRRMGFADSAPETPYANEGWIVFNVSPATNDEPLGWVCTESGNPATSTNAIFEAFGTNLIGATITDFARYSILTCDDESDLAAALCGAGTAMNLPGDAERLLATGTVNMQNGDGKTTVYTVPTGVSAIVTKVIIRNPSASLAGGNDFDIGDGANADTWKTTIDLSSLTATTDCIVIFPDAKFTVFNATDTFGIKPATGATADATATMMVYGIEY